MSSRRLYYALSALGLSAAFLLVGCGPQADLSTNAAPVTGAVAAQVNEDVIYVSDVELEAIAQGLIEPGASFTAAHPEYQTLLDQLIDQRLLAQEALRRRLDQSPDARRRLAAGRERLLGNILVENLVATEVTEDAINAMYDEQVKLQQLDDEVRVRHILTESEAEAATIRTEIEAGRDFTDAAFEYSADVRTRLEGGDFGWVSPNNLPDPFPAIIGDTETGSISDPFMTERGWHILKVDERRTRPPKTKDEMRPEIITFLTFTQISDILRDLRAGADIRVLDYAQTTPTPDDAVEPDPEDVDTP